ncbi:MAG: TonB family protein [Bacteroidota bacterium]
MKPLLVFISLILAGFFAACSSAEQTTDFILPQLIYQHPLPAYPKPITSATLKISLEMYVSKEGAVSDVRLLNSSGSIDWDSAAMAAIYKWRYTPALSGDTPISIWLRQTAVVRFSEPQYVILGEILCKTAEEADSAFAHLEHGIPFSEVVVQYSIGESKEKEGKIGTVNILIYPEHIKNMLARLGRNEFTKPVQFGTRYAIFKRLKE